MLKAFRTFKVRRPRSVIRWATRQIAVYSISSEYHAQAAVASLTKPADLSTLSTAERLKGQQHAILCFLRCYRTLLPLDLFPKYRRLKCPPIDLMLYRRDQGLFRFDLTVPKVALCLSELLLNTSILKVTRHADELFSSFLRCLASAGSSAEDAMRLRLASTKILDLHRVDHKIVVAPDLSAPWFSLPLTLQRHLLTPLESILSAYGNSVDLQTYDAQLHQSGMVPSFWDTLRTHMCASTNHPPLPLSAPAASTLKQHEAIALVMDAMHHVTKSLVHNGWDGSKHVTSRPTLRWLNTKEPPNCSAARITTFRPGAIIDVEQMLVCKNARFFSMEPFFPPGYIGVTPVLGPRDNSSRFALHYVNDAQRVVFGTPHSRCLAQFFQNLLGREKQKQNEKETVSSQLTPLSKKSGAAKVVEDSEWSDATVPIQFEAEESLAAYRRPLPCIGDIIYRSGKRPKQRKTLPKGIWDAHGRLLPKPGTSSTHI